MFRIRIAAMIVGMAGAVVALAFERVRVPVGLPALAVIALAAGLPRASRGAGRRGDR